MPKYLPPPHKFRQKTLDSTDTVDFTHFRRTVNRYCDMGFNTYRIHVFAQLTNAHVSSGARDLIFALGLHLYPNFASNLRCWVKISGTLAHMDLAQMVIIIHQWNHRWSRCMRIWYVVLCAHYAIGQNNYIPMLQLQHRSRTTGYTF